ncbi:4'-phosphopantetheinyl transferase superfamily protein [Streptomyces sp. AV19]|uniref:4'-phosphopantetheinyl transferase family protein n=1 Tax=Streptomyces sp. AV19 TaxID=2793068 RepID=UPI0018FEA927|nr:4'-phosphopantetheinyl transferase superfamily protein [Streptomyces sp. AV19]MBH1933030.1 4'-phosphopantetheinyl transferase superfamily protein [Streptomyces sp. AV19]MDG4531743.1 4'-phosphopantetheinyl transferase superfamily protein [Streptomyces sp. AV19]
MIEELLPPGAFAEHTFTDATDDPASVLFPEEAERIARAVPRRQREYATVRVCARRALGRLGYAPAPLLSSRRGAPQWPDGVVGSMTHCQGYRAAVVARADDLASVGIDAEPNGPLPDGVLDTIALASEKEWIAALSAAHPAVHWDRLLFSAKESVFKTWYPLTGLELDFDEAELTVDPVAGTFAARLLVPGPVVGGRRQDGFAGRWTAGNGLVVTAIALPLGPAPEEERGEEAYAHSPSGA